MRAINLLFLPIFAILLADFASNTACAAEKCCECGCHYKLKKVYKPVITFKKVKSVNYKYKTVCEDVLVLDSPCCTTCDKTCDGCDCGVSHRCDTLKKVSVPVAYPSKCKECVLNVPCVTWVVECRCEKCCNKCKKSHKKKTCSH